MAGAAGRAGRGLTTAGLPGGRAPPGARFRAKRAAISRRRTKANVAEAESAAAKPIRSAVPAQSKLPSAAGAPTTAEASRY